MKKVDYGDTLRDASHRDNGIRLSNFAVIQPYSVPVSVLFCLVITLMIAMIGDITNIIRPWERTAYISPARGVEGGVCARGCTSTLAHQFSQRNILGGNTL